MGEEVMYAGAEEQLLVGLGIVFWLVYTFIVLVLTVLMGISYYNLSKKANIDGAWMSFVPFLMFIPYFKMIDESPWKVLWLLVPFANIYFGIKFMIKFFKAFGRDPVFAILMYIFVPYFQIGYLLYMAFSKKVEYINGNDYEYYGSSHDHYDIDEDDKDEYVDVAYEDEK